MARTISDDQILEAALNVIVQRGYAGATTREISAAAGMNEVTLFRRFGSKEQLLRAVVEQEAEHFYTSGIEYTGDLEGDLRRVVHFYRDLMAERGRVIAMLINEIPRQPELMALMETPLRIFAEITAMIERYQREGALVAEPPMQALMALVGPVFLGGLMGFVHLQMQDVVLEPEELVQHFLQGRSTA
jgi:AcrR family transcriptional regulator